MIAQMHLIVLAIAYFTALASWLGCRNLSKPSSPLYRADQPNHRSMHSRPIAANGGIAIILCILLAWSALFLLLPITHTVHWIVIGLIVIAGLSLADDYLDLSPWLRLGVHVLVAFAALLAGDALPSRRMFGTDIAALEPVLWIASLLAIIWFINLYNFMDGMDGSAGGMGVIGFAVFSVFGWLVGDVLFAAMTMMVAVACLGFLLLNFPPADLFMGDVGAASLGFLAGVFSLWGASEKIFSWWLPILVFSPFIVDATLTLLQRALKGERIWEPHKKHYFQRLIDMGWSHRKTVTSGYFLMAACGISALVVAYLPEGSGWYMALAWICIYTLLIFCIHFILRKRSRKRQRSAG